MSCPLQLIISWDILVFMPRSSEASVILKGPLSPASLGPGGIGCRMETMPAWETSPVPPLMILSLYSVFMVICPLGDPSPGGPRSTPMLSGRGSASVQRRTIGQGMKHMPALYSFLHAGEAQHLESVWLNHFLQNGLCGLVFVY